MFVYVGVVHVHSIYSDGTGTIPEIAKAASDPYGLRPLSVGIMPDGAYVVASETCAFDLIEANYVRDVLPGDMLVIDDEVIRTGNLKSLKI